MRSGFGNIRVAILKSSLSSWILQPVTLQRLPSAFLSPLLNSLSPLSAPKKENKTPHYHHHHHHHHRVLINPPLGRSRSCSLHTMAESSTSIYDITVKDASGNDVNLGIYRGKVLLIVNVASQCGLTTTNYTELTDIYNKYKDQGLEILAFPCNQFAGQEPGSNEQIKEFVCTRFKAEYPIFGKVDVNGSNTAPIYKYLKSAKLGGIFGDFIKWNFTKFLVNKEGQVVNRFAPTTPPSKIEKDVKKLVEGN